MSEFGPVIGLLRSASGSEYYSHKLYRIWISSLQYDALHNHPSLRLAILWSITTNLVELMSWQIEARQKFEIMNFRATLCVCDLAPDGGATYIVSKRWWIVKCSTVVAVQRGPAITGIYHLRSGY